MAVAPWRTFSFGEATDVLLATGESKPIATVVPGDEATTADPATGVLGSGLVDAVYVHLDTLSSLVTDHGQIETTEDHPFWDDGEKMWQDAAAVESGSALFTPDGSDFISLGFAPESERDGTAYNLTVRGDGTFFVGTGSAFALVHNCGGQSASPIWRVFSSYRGPTRTSGLSGSKWQYYQWDYTHENIEVYDKNGFHLGVMHPLNGKMIGKAVTDRKIKI